jgi:hypothetical protein
MVIGHIFYTKNFASIVTAPEAEISVQSRGGIFSLDRVRTCFEVCTLSEKGYDTWEKISLKKEEDEEFTVLKKKSVQSCSVQYCS